ncbi:TPA: hypothetical protein DEP21_00720 [Patescibacteria group bacterium]|nr:hypothetical protein [Candidatus Gracilibacteria bacterium]
MIKQNVPINDHLLKTLKNNPSSILLDFMSKKTFPPQIGIDFWIDAISKSQNIDYVDSYGETLLMLFMRFGSPSDVQFLLGL